MVDGAGHDNTRAPSEELLGSDCGQSQVSKAEARRIANRAFLRAFEAMWDAYPDMRFGQLVMNISRTDGGFADTWEWTNTTWRKRIEETWRLYREAALNTGDRSAVVSEKDWKNSRD